MSQCPIDEHDEQAQQNIINTLTEVQKAFWSIFGDNYVTNISIDTLEESITAEDGLNDQIIALKIERLTIRIKKSIQS